MTGAHPEVQAEVQAEVEAAVEWFLTERFEAEHGVGATPFYCDEGRVGAFAVDPVELAAGTEAALFKLFVGLTMYQALRDVLIMRRQLEMPKRTARVLANLSTMQRAMASHACSRLRSVEVFEAGCDVWKRGGRVDCDALPGVACHVKEATVAYRRMGDMGKLPTSAWLRGWQGGVGGLLAEVCAEEVSPTRRAELMVARLAGVYRVGRKLATMYVSALSTPSLAPASSPWYPALDGNELVVVDTNVARAVDALRDPAAKKTYEARSQWVRHAARGLDLRRWRDDVPSYSPRLVQQALYAYCSKSNRVAQGDACSSRGAACAGCARSLCPFAARAEG